MARSSRRGVALLALTASAGLLAAAGTAPAGAATTPAFYGGTTSGDVVKLVLTLPGQDPLGIGLISANGTSLYDPKGLAGQPQASRAFAGLGSGTLVEEGGPLAALNQSVVATLADPSPAPSSFGSLPGEPAHPLRQRRRPLRRGDAELGREHLRRQARDRRPRVPERAAGEPAVGHHPAGAGRPELRCRADLRRPPAGHRRADPGHRPGLRRRPDRHRRGRHRHPQRPGRPDPRPRRPDPGPADRRARRSREQPDHLADR